MSKNFKRSLKNYPKLCQRPLITQILKRLHRFFRQVFNLCNLPFNLWNHKEGLFQRSLKKDYLKIKRIFDISLALMGIMLLFPLWLIFGFLIWWEDRGPIFYLQERVGKDGKIFESIKFRSMRPDAEKGIGPVQAKENDPRVTKIGRFLRKTAMDESPQLLNIFRGEMSFVGPRALRPIEIETTDTSGVKAIFQVPGFERRSTILPGLTGVAQAFTPRNLPRGEKFRYDLWYIDNMSFWWDIKLIIKSILITFKARWDI